MLITVLLRFFASIFVLSQFPSIASLTSYFSDGIEGAVIAVSCHLTSTFGGRVAGIHALVLPLLPRAVSTCGS